MISVITRIGIILSLMFAATAKGSPFLSKEDIKKLPFTPAPYQFHYGEDQYQFGDLRIPEGPGPHPVLIIIHGGCWLSSLATIDFMSPFAQAFTQLGYATWNIEYRCMDNPGGGWPGTFQDVSNAVDYVRVLAAQFNLDLNRVVVIGHSAGGHLALWAGARHRIKDVNSPVFIHDPLKIKGIVNLAGPGDLEAFAYATTAVLPCSNTVIEKLFGDIQQTSPYELLPLSIKQILICGDKDHVTFIDSMQKYTQQALRHGDEIEMRLIANAAHFEVVAPYSNAWPTIVDAVQSLDLHQ